MAEQQGGPRRLQAVALAYGDNDQAPRVLAQGYGLLAERIIAEARRQGIFVHDDPALVSLLMRLDIDEQIPPGLYQVIAELLCWAWELRGAEPARSDRA